MRRVVAKGERQPMKVRKKWRLYVDHNVELETIRYLRERGGFDVLAVCEDVKLRHFEDEFHYQNARTLERYLLTHDDDYWGDRRFPLRQSPGVIIIPKNEEDSAKYFPVLLRKIIDQDYNIDGRIRHLGGMKIRMTWDGMSHKASLSDGTVLHTLTVSWVDLGYKRK